MKYEDFQEVYSLIQDILDLYKREHIVHELYLNEIGYEKILDYILFQEQLIHDLMKLEDK